MRPGMYFGGSVGNRIFSLLGSLYEEAVYRMGKNPFTFSITLCAGGDVVLDITGGRCDGLFDGPIPDACNVINYWHILPDVSAFIKIHERKDGMDVQFHPDEAIFPQTHVDYYILLTTFMRYALLNRQTTIKLVDSQKSVQSQNHLHFPEGVFYLFDAHCDEVLGTPDLLFRCEGSVKGYSYQIALAYRSDWYPQPYVLSFGNDIHTIDGGDHVNGVMDGYISALKAYVKHERLTGYLIRRKKCLNGLILVCAVRGESLVYGGSVKDSLNMPELRKQLAKVVRKTAFDYLCANPETTNRFLWRFDAKALGSALF